MSKIKSNQKFIIIYNESIRSKIIYQNFIINNYSLIRAVVKVPNLPKTINLNSFLKIVGLKYLFFSFFQSKIFEFIGFFFSSTLKSLCKRKKIKFYNFNSSIKKKDFRKFGTNKNDIIFYSTLYKIEKNILEMSNVFLNFHEADPKKYRGTALYYYQLLNNEKSFKTCILEPNEKLDSGRIIKISPKIKIKTNYILETILNGYFSQSKLINSLNYNNIKKKYPKKNSNKITSAYTIPTRQTEKDLSIKKLKFLNFENLKLLLKMFITNQKI